MRTVTQALSYLNDQIRRGRAFEPGECLRESHDAYLVPSDGTPDATTAWKRTKHRFTGRWVRGAFLYWTGGSEGHGHVAIARWRRGHIDTVDYPHVGHWNHTTVTELERAWPRIEWAGMALDVDGVQVRKMPRLVRRWTHN